MRSDLLTSTEVARLLGVGPTTVKRWADAGLINCIKTAGKHRRFPRSEVERLLTSRPPLLQEGPGDSPPEVDSWIQLLAGDAPLQALQAELLGERARAGSFWAVADGFAAVLRRLGQLWASGQLSIMDEHLASERLARALAITSQALPTAREAPRALLAVPEGEEHTLGLSLAELVLREAGWATRWAGRRTPLVEISGTVRAGRVEMVALSASAFSVSAEELGRQAELVASACREARVTLVLGGEGAWPEHLSGTHRLHSFAELRGLLDHPGTLHR